MPDLPSTQKVVRLHPPGRDVRVEEVPMTQVQELDESDALVKIRFSGLCGSDLHNYRGHPPFNVPFVMGHEFVGTVVALGSRFQNSPVPARIDRSTIPELYSTLKIGDKVVSPFTSSCGECRQCSSGFTSRCQVSRLFGTGSLPGAQAQFIRVPKAGGTLFKIPPNNAGGPGLPDQHQWASVSEESFLLLADILPTGVFAALQALNHPNLAPIFTKQPFPLSSLSGASTHEQKLLRPLTSIPQTWGSRLSVAVIGLGPVGLCSLIALLDLLSARSLDRYHILALDPVQERREKAEKIVKQFGIPEIASFAVAAPGEATPALEALSGTNECDAVLEVVGNNTALTLAAALVKPFGMISSVGVHTAPTFPITGGALYDKNISMSFGRCPVRSIFPVAADLLVRRQDIFGTVGQEISLIERVVVMEEAETRDAYDKFDKNVYGKVLFDPWG